MIHGSVKTIPRSGFFAPPRLCVTNPRNYLFCLAAIRNHLTYGSRRELKQKKVRQGQKFAPGFLADIRRLQIFHRCSAFLSRGENESEMGTNLDRPDIVSVLFNNRTAEKLIDSKKPRVYWLEAVINGWDVVTFTAALSSLEQR